MAPTVIEVRDLTRIYHIGDVDVHALAGVDLTVKSGEFLAIVGASGSGKSTLMNILGCLDRPSGRRYLFEGLDVAELAEPALARIRSERIGFVFQSFNLLARTSAIENVGLPLFYADGGPTRRSPRRARPRRALGFFLPEFQSPPGREPNRDRGSPFFLCGRRSPPPLPTPD